MADRAVIGVADWKRTKSDLRRLAKALYVFTKKSQLVWILVIAGKQDHRARSRVPDALAVLVRERRAQDVDHRRARRQPYFSHSRITVAMAMPRSSVRERWE